MKKRYWISLAIIITFCSGSAIGQNYLTQSFDAASLPSGWDNSTYIYPPSGCASPYGCGWVREPGGTGNPGPATHSGAGYMFYNSNVIDTGGGEGRLISPSINFSIYSSGTNQVSFWMYRDYEANYFADSLVVFVGTNPSLLAARRLGVIQRDAFSTPTVLATGWYKYTYTIPATYTGTTNYIIFEAYSNKGYDIYLDDVSVDHIPVCSGTPIVSGITPSGPITRCVGTIDTLVANTASVSGLKYQWQVSNDTGATWVNILNDTNQYKVALTLKTILYRVTVSCASSSTTTTPISVFASGSKVKYSTLPYSQSFESWLDHCDSYDIPDSSWTIYPATGNDAWRRDDQGVAYGGWSNALGGYTPAYFDTVHSARFHSYAAAAYSRGEMNLFFNCSADTVHGKELRFYYTDRGGLDGLTYMLSTDSGLTFVPLGVTAKSEGWSQYQVPFFSKSPRTVLKFIATADGSSDMGIDKVQVLAPCTGKPVAGTVNEANPCYGAVFRLGLTGTSESADLTYRWQSSTNGTSWTDVTGATTPTYGMVQFVNTYYRVIVKCSVSTLSDTSNTIYAKLKSFYYCYCDPMAAIQIKDPQDNIGNVAITQLPSSVTVMSNGSASPIVNNSTAVNSYSNFDSTITAPYLYLDSLYRFAVTEISKNAGLDVAPVYVYLDLDHNGEFATDEAIVTTYTSGSSSSPTVSDTFRIPIAAKLGLTGLRVKLGVGETTPLDPCLTVDTLGHQFWVKGEYEDYLVNISYPPCTGHLNAGKIKTPDRSTCVGHSFVLTDTTHEMKKINTTWIWQQSADSIIWSDIIGTSDKDSITQVFSSSIWYRLKMICIPAADTSYSDTVHITQNPPYECYCESYADGGIADTSDIGAFVINGFVFSKGGSHTNNAKAIYSREHFYDPVIDLYADSTYAYNIYYIMRYSHDANARVTLFMDFDNNHQYDLPTERVLTTTTNVSGFYITDSVTIPHTVFDGVPVGMRLIINNNTVPNVPSDNACGSYVSGETMDFLVRFNIKKVGIDNINSLQDFVLYPNPTTGNSLISFHASELIHDLEMQVTDMIGKVVLQQSYTNVSGEFRSELDLHTAAKGMYFVEIIADKKKMIKKLVIK